MPFMLLSLTKMSDSMPNPYHTDAHRMGRRSYHKDYSLPGIYHVTMTVADRRLQPFGCIVGNVDAPDGSPDAPHVELSDLGKMVEYELVHSISVRYPMVEVQDYVIMPDHVHCIMVVKSCIISRNGRKTHLGQLISGFKKGCSHRYWEMTGVVPTETQQGNPAAAGIDNAGIDAAGIDNAGMGAADVATLRPAGCPQVYRKIPSDTTTGRPQLFMDGYVDVMPLKENQLETQRAYIRNNPRYRLLRSKNRAWMTVVRGGIDTSLSLAALHGYLLRECGETVLTPDTWASLSGRLLRDVCVSCRLHQGAGIVGCDSYGDRILLEGKLLPVVCHRKDFRYFSRQKVACLEAARQGAVLVSAHISKGEQEIINSVMEEGWPVINIDDHGIPEMYHPSERRMALCAERKLLIVTPWQYHFRRPNEVITVAECKTMNCLAQALCRRKDDWWKNGLLQESLLL